MERNATSSDLVRFGRVTSLVVLLVAVAGDPDPFPAEHLEREIRGRVDALATVRTDTRFVRVETVKIPPPESYDVAIVDWMLPSSSKWIAPVPSSVPAPLLTSVQRSRLDRKRA